MKTIALNADAETAYELFAGAEPSLGDSAMLYRGIYHEIGNEVAILKSISQRILRKIEGEHPLVQEIVADLDDLKAKNIKELSPDCSVPKNTRRHSLEFSDLILHE